MIRFIRTIILFLIFWSTTGLFFVGDPQTALGAIMVLALVSLVFGAYETLSDCNFEPIWRFYKFINIPLRRHYEARERNYKDIISKLEQQLYQTKQEQEPGTISEAKKRATMTVPSGSAYYLDYFDRYANGHCNQRIMHPGTTTVLLKPDNNSNDV